MAARSSSSGRPARDAHEGRGIEGALRLETHTQTHVENRETGTKQEKRLEKNLQELQSSPKRVSVY